MTGKMGYQIKFDGHSEAVDIASEADPHIERAAKLLGLWSEGRPFPGFTLYRDGEEIGGGGDR